MLRQAVPLACLAVVLTGCVVEPPPEPAPAGVDGGAASDGQAGADTLDAAAPADAQDAATARFSPDATPPWPTAAAALPPCTPTPGALDLPALATSGDLELTTDGFQSAIGVDELIDVRIRQAGSTDTDTKAKGPLTVTPDTGMKVVQVGKVSDGVAVIQVRFETPGKHKLVLTLPDGRKGEAELFAYATALAVWEVEIATPDFFVMMTNPYDKKYFPVTLKAEGKTFAGTEMRLHGGASAEFPKKNLRFNLADGQKLASGERKLVLRGEYNDKTMLRSWLGYEVFRQATWLPAPKSAFVHLRINGRYYGLMHQVQRIGGDFLAQWGRDPDGLLYEADPPVELANNPGGNLTPLAPELYSKVYQAHAGATSFAPLAEFIEKSLQKPDAAFFAELDTFLKLDDYLAYTAGMAVLQNHEHIRKNFLLYRDPKGKDPRWEVFAWDLDLTLGHLWTEKFDVHDETLFTDRPLDVGAKKPEHDFYNQLYRTLNHPPYRARFEAAVKKVAAIALDPAFIDSRLAWYQCRVGPDLVADRKKRATLAEYPARVEEIRTFAKARKAFILNEIGK